MSKFDQIYRSILLSKFFTKGWGNPELLRKIIQFRRHYLQNPSNCASLVSANVKLNIDKEQRLADGTILEGSFTSPMAPHFYNSLPKESHEAKVQIILPKTWKGPGKPMCIHLAGTGDHFYWRRRVLFAWPLLKQYGIGSIILENPYYGLRKPKEQVRSRLHNVTDLFLMGGCLALESMVILRWCEQQGFGPLGLSGISMGGYMASIAASVWTKPVALVPCLSWTSASVVFTRGVMSESIPWPLLENQYVNDKAYSEIGTELSTPEERSQMPSASSSQPQLLMSSKMTSRVMNSAQLHTLRAKNISSGEKGRPPVSSLRQETIRFMKLIMDECTHMANFPRPVDCKSVISVLASDDAYVPRDGLIDLPSLWPGMEIRVVGTGHVAACLMSQNTFRKAIKDALDRQNVPNLS